MDHRPYQRLAAAVLEDVFRDVRRSAAARRAAIDFCRGDGRLWLAWLDVDPDAAADALERTADARVDFLKGRQ